MVIYTETDRTISRVKCIDAMLRLWYPPEHLFDADWSSKRWVMMPVLLFGDCNKQAQQEGEPVSFDRFSSAFAEEIEKAPSWVEEGFKLNKKLRKAEDTETFCTNMTEYSKAASEDIPKWNEVDEDSPSSAKEWIETLVTLIYVHQKSFGIARERWGNLPFNNPCIYDNPVIFK